MMGLNGGFMANLEKLKHKKNKPDERSQLFQEVMKSVPLYSSKEEALRELNSQLEALATKNRLSVEDLLEKAESDTKFNEDYLDALVLARQVAYFKK